MKVRAETVTDGRGFQRAEALVERVALTVHGAGQKNKVNQSTQGV